MTNHIFKIDTVNSDNERCYIDVCGKGTVEIIKSDDGLIVNIYPFHVTDEVVATCWASNSELCPLDMRS